MLGAVIWDVNIGERGSVLRSGRVRGQLWGILGTDIVDVNIAGGRGPGTEIGNVNIVGPGEGGLGTDIRDFIFWEGWFRAGGLWANIGDVNNGAGRWRVRL